MQNFFNRMACKKENYNLKIEIKNTTNQPITKPKQ